jgi:uncharacterized protein with HEPN domain
MSRSYKLYLKDILSAIKKIATYLQGLDYEGLAKDTLRIEGTLYNLMIIGEAAKHVPTAIREKYPDIEWRKIAGLRNIVAHEYWRVELEIIWNIISHDLPELKPQISEILEQEP